MSVQARDLTEILINSCNETVDAQRQVALEQCDGLPVKMGRELHEVKEETAARVDKLLEEVSKLRAATEKQILSQTMG